MGSVRFNATTIHCQQVRLRWRMMISIRCRYLNPSWRIIPKMFILVNDYLRRHMIGQKKPAGGRVFSKIIFEQRCQYASRFDHSASSSHLLGRSIKSTIWFIATQCLCSSSAIRFQIFFCAGSVVLAACSL